MAPSRRSTRDLPLLALLALLVAAVLLQPASAAPASRSQRLMNQQRLFVQGIAAPAAGNLMGTRAAARMGVEVNDYPGTGANHHHDPPKGPGSRTTRGGGKKRRQAPDTV